MQTSECPSELVSFRFSEPFLVVFPREVPVLACDSSVVRITEVAEDVF